MGAGSGRGCICRSQRDVPNLRSPAERNVFPASAPALAEACGSRPGRLALPAAHPAWPLRPTARRPVLGVPLPFPQLFLVHNSTCGSNDLVSHPRKPQKVRERSRHKHGRGGRRLVKDCDRLKCHFLATRLASHAQNAWVKAP